MNFLQFVPRPTLVPFVECYWMAEGCKTFSQQIIPDGYSEMIFHYGDPYLRETSTARAVQQPLAIVAGQITQPLFIRPTGITAIFGVKFKPTGFWKLFGVNMKEICNAAISVDEVTGIDTNAIIHALQTATSVDQRILVENFLMKHAQQARVSKVDFFVESIVKNPGQSPVARLCKDENISLRKVERMFNESVGISAKVFMRLQRFNRIYKLLQQDKMSKAGAAYVCGYFDQSHFNRDFRIFSGEDPGTWFSKSHVFSDFFMSR